MPAPTGWKWAIGHRAVEPDPVPRTPARSSTAALALVECAVSIGGNIVTIDGPPGPPPGGADQIVDATAHPAAAVLDPARVRDRFLGSLVLLDSSVALHGDLIGTGAIARIRLAEVVGSLARRARRRRCAGGGVGHRAVPDRVALRSASTIASRCRSASRSAAGGAVDVDLRFPWGVRAMSGRWSATLDPATPRPPHRGQAAPVVDRRRRRARRELLIWRFLIAWRFTTSWSLGTLL